MPDRARAEVEAELRRLREIEKHRDWRISELEKHVANLEALLAQSTARSEGLELHASNLEAALVEARGHHRDLDAHIANLDLLLAEARARADGLAKHAETLEAALLESRRPASEAVEQQRLVEQRGGGQIERQKLRIAQLNGQLDQLGELAAQRVAALEAQLGAGEVAQAGGGPTSMSALANFVSGRRVPPSVAGYRSRFGGLWPDACDVAERLAAKCAAGAMSARDTERVEEWCERGIMHLPGAVADDAIDALLADSASVYDRGDPQLLVEYYEGGEHLVIAAEPRHRTMNVKLLELHAHLESARRVAFAPPILDFLRLIFEDDPVAFQSLYFRLGSEQPMHQDAAYVQVESPMEFVGVWIALEDVTPQSGPLAYYPGSHRFDEWLWDGDMKAMPRQHPDHEAYLRSLPEQAAARGIEPEVFHPKKGDALVWHADLAHGGTPRLDPGATRTSLVTHYCPRRVDPVYFASGAPHSAKLEHESGGVYCYLSARGPAAR